MNRQRGFTLIELVTVIVVLGIIGGFSVQFIADTIEGYNRSIERGRLIAQGRQALERMSRQLRASVPNSIRTQTLSGFACIEFIPVAGGGNYIGQVPDADNGAPAVSSLSTGGYRVDFGSASRLFIAPLSVAEVYGGSAAEVALSSTLAEGDTGTTLNFSSHTFLRNSISHRFFLAHDAQAFCYTGSQIRYYSDSGSVSPAGGDIVADDVTTVTPFSVSTGSEDRNTLVAMEFDFRRGGEAVTLNREALIRNVP
ncbi:type II secretion system protein [Maricurvus nonylphenolicus]|uniref:type II secretion system protein n=1 Tax=Maricurvus nonylphenolicus TaxID=1008307 RepID=UPI0036F43E42